LTYTFTSAINNAKESILLVVYSLTDPDVIASLKQKSEEGIPIKVICDAKASPYIDSKLGSKIETTRRFGPGLMHQKILVVDKKQTWIGSANMTPESLKMHGNLVAAIDSPLLAEEVIAKAHTLNVEGQGSPFPHFDLTIGEQSLELWFLPDNKDAVARLKKLIQTAEKTIRIAMFTWTRHDLAQEVIAAKKRGLMLEWSSTITLERAPAPKLQPY
jgi:cardiolipin synthase A/B